MTNICGSCSSAPAEVTIFDINNIPYMKVCKGCKDKEQKYVADLALIVN